VPPTLSARVRLLGSVKAAKNGGNDALSTAIAGLRHCGLRPVRPDDHATVLRLLAGRYDDLVALRTQAACRLHAVLREHRHRLNRGGDRHANSALWRIVIVRMNSHQPTRTTSRDEPPKASANKRSSDASNATSPESSSVTCSTPSPTPTTTPSNSTNEPLDNKRRIISDFVPSSWRTGRR
jgi:hypothetical protein